MSDMDDILNFELDEHCFIDSCLDNTYMNTAVTPLPDMVHQTQYNATFSPGPMRSPKRRGRPIANNAARERTRVKTLRSAFLDLQRTLPAVPPDTKLSKLDVLVLATTYIAHLMSALADDADISQIFAANGCMHPVKKWPMRTRLYAGILSSTVPHLGHSNDTSPRREMPTSSWFNDTDGFKR